MHDTISFGAHTEDLHHIGGVSIPYAYAVQRHAVAPDFKAVAENRILVGKGMSGLDAAMRDMSSEMSRHGCSFPLKKTFLSTLSADVLRSDVKLARAIQQHLRLHNMNGFASLIKSRTEYARCFPPEKQRVLKELNSSPCQRWTTEQSVEASLAVNAHNGDHHVFLQVLDYAWVTDQARLHDFCFGVMDSELDGATSLEWEHSVSHVICDNMQWTAINSSEPDDCTVTLRSAALSRHLKNKSQVCAQTLRSFGVSHVSPTASIQIGSRLLVPDDNLARRGKVYQGSIVPIGGMHGKIDCVYRAGSTWIIIEWKVKAELDNKDHVQLFLYMCLYAASHSMRPQDVAGKLVNLRTGEVVHMRLNETACASGALDAALDIHFDVETSVADILARCVGSNHRAATRLQAGSTRQGEALPDEGASER